MKTYSELSKLQTFEERFEYLKLHGQVGEETFGRSRSLNQEFYRSQRWKSVRDRVIIRDGASDLGVPGHEIRKYIIVHHINPVTEEQILSDDPILYDPENLICVRQLTHNAIHYGESYDEALMAVAMDRSPNDTCPWKKGGK